MTDRTISPLCRRMIEDMTVRGFAPATQTGYIRAVRDFTAFFGRSPDRARAEDLRRYQLRMRSIGASATSMNAAVSALRFFFTETLGRDDARVGMTTVREPRKLPVVVSPEAAARLLHAAPGQKYEAALSVAYGAGLRAAEVISLKVADINRAQVMGSPAARSSAISASSRAVSARNWVFAQAAMVKSGRTDRSCSVARAAASGWPVCR